MKRLIGYDSRIINFIRCLRYTYLDIRFHRITKKNKALKNRFLNERCFLLLSGVSLNAIDLPSLKDEYVIACNGVYRHPDFNKLNILAYAIIEPFIGNASGDIRRYAEVHADIESFHITPYNLNNSLLDYYSILDLTRVSSIDINNGELDDYRYIDNSCPSSDTIFFLNAESKKIFNKFKIFSNREKSFVRAGYPIMVAKKQSNDLSKGVTFFDGIAYFMVASALYMGFRQIYLCGAGYTYQPQLMFHFFDSPTFSKEFGSENIADAVNQFAASKSVDTFDIYDLGDIYKPLFVSRAPVDQRHTILKKFAESMGAMIHNITPDGFESPVYEKISWERIRGKVICK